MRHRSSEFQIVRRDDHRTPDLVESLEQCHRVPAELGVEIPGRFVGEQQRWTVNHRTRDPDPLLLAAGKHRRLQAFPFEQTDEIQSRAYPPAHLAVTITCRDQWQRHVVEYGPLHEKPVILEHHAKVTTVQRNVAWPKACEIVSADHHVAASTPLDQGDQPEHRTLAGPGVSGDEYHLTGRDVEIH